MKSVFFESYGVTIQDLESYLAAALERGGDYADLFFELKINHSIVLEEQIVKTATKAVNLGVGVRVLSGEKTGYAHSDDLSRESILKAAQTAAFIASASAKGGKLGIETASPKEHDLYSVPLLPADLAISDKIGLLRQADEAARAYDARIRQVQASYVDETRHVLLVSSDGRYTWDIQPMVRLNVLCTAEENGKRQSGHQGGGGRRTLEIFRDDLEPAALAREAARQAILQLNAGEAPAGTMEVVLGPGWPGILLHEAIGHGLEADFNRKKTSAFSGLVGQKVASELCTVVDDGTIPFRRGSLNMDDEGNPTRQTVLIEKGILQGYLQDHLSAKFMGAPVTGNGRRQGYDHIPLPRMTNTFMMAGQSTPDEIIRSVKKGLYAVHFSGGQVDITSGKFVFSASEAYLIEDGRITTPVKEASLIGDGPTVLRQVTMVGHDLKLDQGVGICSKEGQSLPVGIGLPTIKIREITVGWYPQMMDMSGANASPVGRSQQDMSGANASPVGRSQQDMSGANASPIGRSQQDMSGANASPIGRSQQELMKETAQRVVDRAKKQGATDADVFLREDETFSVTVRNGEVEKLKEALSRSLRLRLFLGKRTATAQTSDLSPAVIDKLVDETVEMARLTSEDESGGLPDPSMYPVDTPDLQLVDPAWDLIKPEARIDLARRAEAAAFKASPSITNSEGGWFECERSRTVLANTAGFMGGYEATGGYLAAGPIAESNGSMQQDHWFSISRKFDQLDSPEDVGRRAAERVVRRLGARKVKTCQVPIIFDPMTARTIVKHVFDAVAGDAIYRRRSFLVDQIGQNVAGSQVTVVDDARLLGGLGSSPFDDEGVATQITPIIESGILRNYLHSAYSARKMKARPTGNGSRTGAGSVTVGPTNFYLKAGSYTPEEIIASVETGLYVVDLIGHGVNPVSGDYSRGVTGLWIENGKFVYPVQEVTIAGNLRQMLQDIEMIGNDITFMGPIASPTLKLRNMTLSGE